ncbi:hypothetical protein BKA64DRAFT_778848 [Cadophora sp. MPI-SDFR-AT-0126]|nr:hypothetical protein BKA64DRAFT_778848 [Leotiomycetes sp. MPI-SDFR-AT-0126]
MAQPMFPGLANFAPEHKTNPEDPEMASMSDPTAMISPYGSRIAESLHSHPMNRTSKAMPMPGGMRAATPSYTIQLSGTMSTVNLQDLYLHPPGSGPFPTATDLPKRKRGRPRKDPSDTANAPYKARRQGNAPPPKKSKTAPEPNISEHVATLTREKQKLQLMYDQEVLKNDRLHSRMGDLVSLLYHNNIPIPVERPELEWNHYHGQEFYDYKGTFSQY